MRRNLVLSMRCRSARHQPSLRSDCDQDCMFWKEIANLSSRACSRNRRVRAPAYPTHQLASGDQLAANLLEALLVRALRPAPSWPRTDRGRRHLFNASPRLGLAGPRRGHGRQGEQPYRTDSAIAPPVSASTSPKAPSGRRKIGMPRSGPRHPRAMRWRACPIGGTIISSIASLVSGSAAPLPVFARSRWRCISGACGPAPCAGALSGKPGLGEADCRRSGSAGSRPRKGFPTAMFGAQEAALATGARHSPWPAGFRTRSIIGRNTRKQRADAPICPCISSTAMIRSSSVSWGRGRDLSSSWTRSRRRSASRRSRPWPQAYKSSPATGMVIADRARWDRRLPGAHVGGRRPDREDCDARRQDHTYQAYVGSIAQHTAVHVGSAARALS